MTADNGEIDWRRLREFSDVDLERSFVLSWKYAAGALFVDIDLLLLPKHPFYEPPRPAEKVCIRPAILEFPFCISAGPAGVAARDDVAVSVERLGIGAIEGLRVVEDGQYEIVGDFGAIRIESERPLLRLKGP